MPNTGPKSQDLPSKMATQAQIHQKFSELIFLPKIKKNKNAHSVDAKCMFSVFTIFFGACHLATLHKTTFKNNHFYQEKNTIGEFHLKFTLDFWASDNFLIFNNGHFA